MEKNLQLTNKGGEGMESFNEFDKTGQGISTLINTAMEIAEIMFNVHFRQPRHDIARRFLNEITEFKPLEEG